MIEIRETTSNYVDQIDRIYPNKNKTTKTITFQVTDDCCMHCTYCYQINKSKHYMTFSTAKQFIDQLLNLTTPLDYINPNNTTRIIFESIGGEPLSAIDLIIQLSDYITNQLIQLNHPWLFKHRFQICSNGLLYFNPKVQQYLQKYSKRLSFTISLDGNQELHDLCRLDVQGNGTYNKVLEAILHYKQNYDSNLPTKMTFSPETIHYVSDAILNLIKLGYKDISANCIFEKGWTNQHATIFYYELKKLANYFLNNSLDYTIYLSLFNLNDFNLPEGEENWCGGTNDHMLALDYEGNLYPCLRYMKDSLGQQVEPIIIGNIHHGIYTTSREKQFQQELNTITRRSQSSDECYNCPIGSGCSWCSAYNYQDTGSINCRVTYICPMHYARALANQYFFKKQSKLLKLPFKNLQIPKQKALEIISKDEWEEIFND